MSDPAPSPPRSPRPDRAGSTRSKARKRALDILFEAELRDRDPLVTLLERSDDADPPVRDYTAQLVRGVTGARAAVDGRIRAGMTGGWSLERMPRVDRAAARIAVYELDFLGLPPGVVVAEAVALVSDLSTDDSPGYLNGLLASVVAHRDTAGPAAEG